MNYDSKYSWFRLLVTLLIATIGNVGMWAIIVIMPSVESEFAIDRATASIPYALTMIGFAFGNIFFGKIVDNYGIIVVLVISSMLCSVCYFLAIVTNSISIFSIIHFFLGLGSAASFGPLIADISHWFKKRRGLAVSIAASGNYFSGAIWPLILSKTLSENGWRSVYFSLAIITLLILILSVIFLRTKIPIMFLNNETKSSKLNFEKKISDNKLCLFLCVAGVGCCVAMSMPQVHVVSYCVDLGYGAIAGGQMLSVMLLGGIISRLISGIIADTIGGLKTLFIGSFLQCLALFFYIPFDGIVSLYVISLFFGLSQGGIIPSYTIIIREYMPSEEAGTRIGIVIMLTIFGMALGGWMSGKIFDIYESYEMAFLNGIFWNFINLGIVIYLLLIFFHFPKKEEIR